VGESGAETGTGAGGTAAGIGDGPWVGLFAEAPALAGSALASPSSYDQKLPYPIKALSNVVEALIGPQRLGWICEQYRIHA